MKLSTLDRFNNIVIQMHDNPDADAVGSGYAMYRYFKSREKNVRLIYGGDSEITKSNILLLIRELEIPVEYVKELEEPELLLMVDCQYGEGNVQKFPAKNIATIDHHNSGRISGEMSEIRSHIVSCSTICYDMLKKEGFDVNSDRAIATALYYGLYMDSNAFSELRHSLERDMLDYLKADKSLLKRLVNSNFTLKELETAGIALIRYSFDEKKHVSIIKSNPCDTNILGLIGDLVLQVDTINVCIIYNESQGGYRMSVRSCVAEVAANDLAEFMTENIGNGGGHNDKAGGFINGDKYTQIYGGLGIEAYFFERVEKYYDSFDVIYTKDGIGDETGFEKYRKKPVTLGYIKTMDVFEKGKEYRVRTYENDVYIVASEDTYIMIGYFGEMYPIDRASFERKYVASDEAFYKKFEYMPTARNMSNDEVCELISYAKKCVCTEEAVVCAKELNKAAKVFTRWDYEKYMLGAPGDYICHPEGNNRDLYIIKRKVMDATYEKL